MVNAWDRPESQGTHAGVGVVEVAELQGVWGLGWLGFAV